MVESLSISPYSFEVIVYFNTDTPPTHLETDVAGRRTSRCKIRLNANFYIKIYKFLRDLFASVYMYRYYYMYTTGSIRSHRSFEVMFLTYYSLVLTSYTCIIIGI